MELLFLHRDTRGAPKRNLHPSLFDGGSVGQLADQVHEEDIKVLDLLPLSLRQDMNQEVGMKTLKRGWENAEKQRGVGGKELR